MDDEQLEVETIREIMYFSAINFGVEREVAERLDGVLCKLLNISDPEPIIDQT